MTIGLPWRPTCRGAGCRGSSRPGCRHETPAPRVVAIVLAVLLAVGCASAPPRRERATGHGYPDFPRRIFRRARRAAGPFAICTRWAGSGCRRAICVAPPASSHGSAPAVASLLSRGDALGIRGAGESPVQAGGDAVPRPRLRAMQCTCRPWRGLVEADAGLADDEEAIAALERLIALGSAKRDRHAAGVAAPATGAGADRTRHGGRGRPAASTRRRTLFSARAGAVAVERGVLARAGR